MGTRKFARGNSVKNPANYQRIYENSFPEILIFYNDYRCISANPMACSLFDMTEEEIRSRSLTDLVDYNDPRMINLVDVSERTGKANGEITLVRKNGSKLICEVISSTFMDENGEWIIDIVIRELVNRKQEEEELSRKVAYVSGLNTPKLKVKKPVTILFAEKDEIISLIFQMLLADPLIKIIIADNGVEAVSKCKEISDFDLVFMDIDLPQMDGYEATRKIREFRPDLPIIAQTSNVINNDQAFECGFTDCIRKPFSKTELISIINKYLSHKK